MAAEPSTLVRIGRVRTWAAIGVVVALAAGWVGLTRSASTGAAADRASVKVTARTVDGVEVEYRRVDSGSLRTEYLDAIGSTASRSWSRPEQPRRVVGQFARRQEQGRAAMWWTVTDRGLLVHAVALDGDPAAILAWWLSHSER